MKPTDDHAPDHRDLTKPRPDTIADDRLAADLAGLQPAAASADLRNRIAAELAAPVAPIPARRLVRGIAERLAWAAAGALAASLVITLASGRREPGEPPATLSAEPAAVAGFAAEPSQAGRPLVAEEAIAWSDEGVRFIDGTTPARVLRRSVLERHLADDGRAEVRIPREDFIFLPVALR